MAKKTRKGRHCRARRSDGRPCRAWAVRGSAEALCQAHGGQKPASEQAHSMYECSFTPEESQEVAQSTADLNVMGEIAINRVLLRRLMIFLRDGGHLTPDQVASLSAKVQRGSRIVSHLLQDMHTLREIEGERGDERIPPWMAYALDALGEKWNLDL